jgi:hypothetical protein
VLIPLWVACNFFVGHPAGPLARLQPQRTVQIHVCVKQNLLATFPSTDYSSGLHCTRRIASSPAHPANIDRPPRLTKIHGRDPQYTTHAVD